MIDRRTDQTELVDTFIQLDSILNQLVYVTCPRRMDKLTVIRIWPIGMRANRRQVAVHCFEPRRLSHFPTPGDGGATVWAAVAVRALLLLLLLCARTLRRGRRASGRRSSAA